MPLERGLDLRVGEIGERHDAVREAARAGRIGDRLQPGRLRDRIAAVDLGLQMHRLHDLQPRGIRQKIAQPVALADRRQVARGVRGLGPQPRIVVPL
jgi:hypothetical protein